MKKLLTVVLAFAMILQTSVIAFAAENMDVEADMVAKVNPVKTNENIDLRASIQMSAVAKAFKDKKDEVEKGITDADKLQKFEKTPVTGDFTLSFSFINTADIVLPSTLVNGTNMDGFNADASEVFAEKSARTVETFGIYKTLNINVGVKDGINVGNLYDKLKDMTFDITGIRVSKASELKFTGAMSGNVKIAFSSTKWQDLNIVAKKGGNADIDVFVTVNNPAAEMKIKVVDDSNAPIKDATVTIGNFAAVLTDGSGIAAVADVPYGIYNVRVVSPDGKKTITKDFELTSTAKEFEVVIPAEKIVNTSVNNNTSDGVIVIDIDKTTDSLKEKEEIKNALDDASAADVRLEIHINDTTDDEKIEKIIGEVDSEEFQAEGTYIDVKTSVNIGSDEVGDIEEEHTVRVAIPYNNIEDSTLKVFSATGSGSSAEVKEIPFSSAGTAGTYEADDNYVYVTIPVGGEASYAVISYVNTKPEPGIFSVTFETNDGKEAVVKTVEKGSTVARPTDPLRYGYVFNGWYLDGSLYDFSKPVTADIILKAAWRKSSTGGTAGGGKYIPSTGSSTVWKNPFLDVSESDWFYEVVKSACKNELMNGVSANYFDPNADITRGMFVTVLYRMAGSPITGVLNFTDVPSYEYYASAIAWAHKAGIVKGISDSEFAPDDRITREQMAAILHRYMQYNNLDTTAGNDTNILSYSDSFSISEYAVPSVQWAVATGVMIGNGDGTFAPINNATRAEAAAVFVRTLEYINKLAD